MSVEKDILQALQQKVIAAVAASTIPTMPIKFIGVAFDPPDNQKWLELVFITNSPPDQYWGDEEYHRGIFRIILHWPNDGSGSYAALDYIGAIANSFSKGQRLANNVKILSKPKLEPPLESGLEILYSLTLQYDLFEV